MTKGKTSWPPELKQPIVLGVLQEEISRAQSAKNFHIDLMDAVHEERVRRIEILAKFVGQFAQDVPRRLPEDEYEWSHLLIAVCQIWKIPGFHLARTTPPRPGAEQFWTDERHCELFADVQNIVKAGKSERAACAFIAKNARTFGTRYPRPAMSRPDSWSKTLLRQFVTAKRKMRNDPAFRVIHFGEPR
jgi:hypothetical protein